MHLIGIFTISIGNEQRSGRTWGTTYTPVQHEAADSELAPTPLAMPCLVPRHGGVISVDIHNVVSKKTFMQDGHNSEDPQQGAADMTVFVQNLLQQM
ncbi:hypothetical protein FRX31_032831, partial [Thalictrum thalictroides]